MKKYENTSHSVNVLFVIVLFGLFTILSVMLIFIGSDVYGRITHRQSIDNEVRTCISYVTNKVRNADTQGSIYIEEKEDTKVLVIENDYDTVVLNTLLYYYDGAICEATVVKGDEYSLNFGEKVFEVADFNLEYNEEGNIITFQIKDSDGKEYTSGVAIRTDSTD